VNQLKKLLVPWILSLLLKLLAKTYRWQLIGLESEGQWWSQGEPHILTFWHGDQLFMPWCYFPPHGSSRPLYALISQHRDGQIATDILAHLKLEAVRGSSSRGGVKALVTLRKKLAGGNHIAITPDGPKGPIHKVKQGVISLASGSSVPILPVALAADRAWVLSSWDKMKIPKPFAKVAIVAGEPRKIAAKISKQKLQNEAQELEKILNQLSQQAENKVSVSPIFNAAN
jgi:lysophospholipid acyltransferase (LPLAT)-like uncharacterized protein